MTSDGEQQLLPSATASARAMNNLRRVAVVTGGASGLGLSICQHLAGAGRSVAVLDVNADAAAELADRLRTDGTEAVACGVDVADRAAVDAVLAQVRHQLGPIDILVTSAGIAAFVPFEEISLDDWHRMITVNLTGTFHCMQAAVPDMVAAGWGRIVTISSASGQVGSLHQGHYAAAKGGVIALTKAVALEYASRGITANTIPPYTVDTPLLRSAQAARHVARSEVIAKMIPSGRLGTGDDIGAMCAFLCSDAASYITGQVIGVNGGAVL